MIEKEEKYLRPPGVLPLQRLCDTCDTETVIPTGTSRGTKVVHFLFKNRNSYGFKLVVTMAKETTVEIIIFLYHYLLSPCNVLSWLLTLELLLQHVTCCINFRRQGNGSYYFHPDDTFNTTVRFSMAQTGYRGSVQPQTKVVIH